MNKAILLGRLGQNPEVRYTQSGQAVANFSLATSKTWTKDGQRQEKTEWHRIVVWGKLAELCSQFLAKGRQALIEGEIQTREWQDQQGNRKFSTEIVAQEVKFLGGGNRDGGQQPNAGNDFDGPSTATEGDIPF